MFRYWAKKCGFRRINGDLLSGNMFASIWLVNSLTFFGQEFSIMHTGDKG